MPACAPQPDGGVCHKHNENCKTNREDEKEADAKYLYRTLGVAEQGVEIGSKTDHKGKRKSTARKIVRVAEDATQRNMELESELRDRNQKLEMLKQVNRERCFKIYKLESSNDELCSIIRHALEDMKRERIGLTNALHDRIKRHATSAPSSNLTDTGPHVSPVPFSQGPSYADNPPCHAPMDTPYERNNAEHAVSSIVYGNNRQDGSAMDTFSPPGPATKRRRGEIATHDDLLWDYSNSRTYLPGSERSGPVQDDYNTDPTGPVTGASASIETGCQAAFAAGASSHQFPRLDSIASQEYHKQASAEAYNNTNQSIGRTVSCGNPRPDSPVLGFESSTRHNVASLSLPQLTSGEHGHPTPSQFPWMNSDQEMMESDFFDTVSESQFWEDLFNPFLDR